MDQNLRVRTWPRSAVISKKRIPFFEILTITSPFYWDTMFDFPWTLYSLHRSLIIHFLHNMQGQFGGWPRFKKYFQGPERNVSRGKHDQGLKYTSVRIHSCSGEHERTLVFALYVFVFFHPWQEVLKQYPWKTKESFMLSMKNWILIKSDLRIFLARLIKRNKIICTKGTSSIFLVFWLISYD